MSTRFSDSPRYRWYALAVLFFVSVINTIDKMLIPALAEPLRLEFDLSDSELGFLVGLVFSVAYGVASVPVGILIDRVNRTRLLATMLIIWSGMTLISARAGSFVSLALCRMGVAAAESGGNPTTLSLISDYFPKHQRGRAIGIFSANSALASVLVFSVAGIIAAEHGWRTVFVVASIPGLIMALLIFLTLKEPKRGAFEDAPINSNEPKASFMEIVKTIGSHKTLLWVTVAAVLVIMGQAGSGAFNAAFFARVHELSLQQAGLATGLIMGLGFAIGTISGGFIADRAGKQSRGGGCRFVGTVTLIAVPLGILGYSLPHTGTAMVLLFIFQVLGSCFYGATLATILDLSPIRMRGSIMTYITLIMNLGGYGFGPQIAGLFSDSFRALGLTDPLRWAMVGMVCIMFVASLCYLHAARRMDKEAVPNANEALNPQQ